ncbi:MAG: RNA polymerase sigma factor [Solirubrobacteraceae bacterium]
MSRNPEPNDAQLLAAAVGDQDAFAAFYARFERRVVAFFVRAVGRGDLAADLTAETFAAALESVERYDPELGDAGAWLFGIARNVLSRSRERGRVEDRARRRMGMGVLALEDEAIERIEASVDSRDGALTLLGDLPDEQRDAVVARVVHGRDYQDIAGELQCSPSVVRKRVSRGLAALRDEQSGKPSPERRVPNRRRRPELGSGGNAGRDRRDRRGPRHRVLGLNRSGRRVHRAWRRLHWKTLQHHAQNRRASDPEPAGSRARTRQRDSPRQHRPTSERRTRNDRADHWA